MNNQKCEMRRFIRNRCGRFWRTTTPLFLVYSILLLFFCLLYVFSCSVCNIAAECGTYVDSMPACSLRCCMCEWMGGWVKNATMALYYPDYWFQFSSPLFQTLQICVTLIHFISSIRVWVPFRLNKTIIFPIYIIMYLYESLCGYCIDWVCMILLFRGKHDVVQSTMYIYMIY